jgi:tetratricopeptide (TPR) repeat protein
MNRRTRYINGKSGAAMGNSASKGFEDDLLLSQEDSTLFETFGEYMKGRLDLEEVRNDPSLPAIDKVVREMISDYRVNGARHSDDEKFIRDIFTGINREKKIMDEISHIKLEIGNSNINEISEEWVKEWHEKRQKNVGKDPETEEIRDFITNSLEPEKSEPEISLNHKEGMGFKRSLLVRYISLSAAAVIVIFVLIRTLLPSSDPGKLYNSYYEPFNVVSPVTRSLTTNEPDSYQAAVERYKLGDYQTAALGFSDAILKDTSVIAPRFFMGITQLALENYDQAINLLTGVAGRSGEYRKEAGWYLGLAYLKTGEKEKAAECFGLLAQSPGYYSERAGKILRRLK